jgi:hypothetical protein
MTTQYLTRVSAGVCPRCGIGEPEPGHGKQCRTCRTYLNEQRKRRTAKAAAQRERKRMSELIYIASPYSHADETVKRDRFDAVCEYAGHLMKLGHVVYSPIAHSHPIAMRSGLPTDWDYWKTFDHAMITRSTSLMVLMLPGWEESEGVKAEVQMAQALGIPIDYESGEVEA